MFLTDGSTYVNLNMCKKIHVGWRKEGKGKCISIFFDDKPVFDLDADDETEVEYKFYDFMSGVDISETKVVHIAEIPLTSGCFLAAKEMWESDRMRELD